MYNFRFTANAAPRTGNATITMYRTGGRATVDVPVAVPSCRADLTDDAVINMYDLFELLGQWGTCNNPCPPSCSGDFTNSSGTGTDCAVDIFDLFVLLSAWGDCE